jgi:hypothetical protein
VADEVEVVSRHEAQHLLQRMIVRCAYVREAAHTLRERAVALAVWRTLKGVLFVELADGGTTNQLSDRFYTRYSYRRALEA